MGYTVRTVAWRYTAWMVWDRVKLEVDWNQSPFAEELYDHALDDGTDFDAFENVNLVAPGAPRTPAVAAAADELRIVLSHRF